MEEENKVVEAEQVEQPQQPAQEGQDPNKFSLITFIMAVVGLAVCFAPVGSVAGIILKTAIQIEIHSSFLIRFLNQSALLTSLLVSLPQSAGQSTSQFLLS